MAATAVKAAKSTRPRVRAGKKRQRVVVEEAGTGRPPVVVDTKSRRKPCKCFGVSVYDETGSNIYTVDLALNGEEAKQLVRLVRDAIKPLRSREIDLDDFAT